MEGGRGISGTAIGDVTGLASSNEWRSDLHPDARRGIVDKLVDALRKTSPASTFIEFKEIAAHCEETIYRNAISEADYLWNLSLKILEWEREHPDNWRLQLHHETREVVLRRIMEVLRRHIPPSSPEGLVELEKIAMRFEEKIYNLASSQSDYLRRISIKILCMEQKSPRRS